MGQDSNEKRMVKNLFLILKPKYGIRSEVWSLLIEKDILEVHAVDNDALMQDMHVGGTLV